MSFFFSDSLVPKVNPEDPTELAAEEPNLKPELVTDPMLLDEGLLNGSGAGFFAVPGLASVQQTQASLSSSFCTQQVLKKMEKN